MTHKEDISFEQLLAHNNSVKLNKTPMYSKNSVRSAVEKSAGEFSKEYFETRFGNKDKKIKPQHITVDKAVALHYGVDLKTFMKQLGVDCSGFTLQDMQEHFGHAGNLTGPVGAQLMLDASSGTWMNFGAKIDGQGSTTDISSDFRFLIPEIMTAAIRIGYEGSTFYQNWIASTQNMATRKLVMPRIERGDMGSSRISEGGSIPVGSLKYGKKEVTVFKVGTGLLITDELMQECTIDQMMEALQQSGIEMSINSDTEALRVLVQGDQADLSESAPVVGVTTVNTYAYKDIKRVFTRMKRLKNEANRIIAGEDDGIDITAIDRFEGFNGDTRLANIQSIIGVPDRFDIDTHVPPANQILFLSPSRCMVKLVYKSMLVERDRNAQNQTNALYVSDHIGFGILRRDGRVLLDKSVTIGASPFPSYMNIDARIAAAFKTT